MTPRNEYGSQVDSITTRADLFRCSRCLYPNTKPDLHFVDGLCSACMAFDARSKIDWAKRQDKFLELIDQNRGATHDVIVACSGGKDSTAQIVKCLDLGLRPLAITATTDHLSPVGRRNLDNISNLCDHVEVTPHKPTRRKIAKFALEEVGDISWCEHHLIWSVPAREAQARNIPIVLYGEAQNNEYGAGAVGTEQVSCLDKSWVDEYGGLLGLRLSDMTEILGIEQKHLEIYQYPKDAGKVKALFMGAFFEWDGYKNFEIAKAHGFTPYPADIEGSLFGYENLDNCQTGVHDAIRYWKFCYTRAVDIASNHIRRGRLTREKAIELCQRVEGYIPSSYLGTSLVDILGLIGMSVAEFQEIAARFMDRKMFEVKDGWPSPKFRLDDEIMFSMQASKVA